MRKLFFLTGAILLSCIFSFAQTSYTDDCSSVVGWDQSSNAYKTSTSNGEVTFNVSWGNTQWVGVYNSLDGQMYDISTNPVLTVKIKALDKPFVLTVYLFDTVGNTTLSQRVLPSDDFVTLTYDFSSATGIDFTVIEAIQFTCNGKSRGYSGTFVIDDLEIGTTAVAAAAIGGQRNKQHFLNSGSKTILLTDIANADNITVSGGAGIITNLAVTAISNGQATVSYDLVTDATGTATISVTANGSTGYADNTIDIDVIVEDNLAPIINQADDVEMADGSTIEVLLEGIGDGNLSKEQIVAVTATSNNQAIISNSDIVVDYTSDSPKGVLELTASSTGTTTITVVVSDDGGGTNSVSMSFDVVVFQSLNGIPTIDDIEDQMAFDSSPTLEIDLTGISDGDGGTQTLTLEATSSNSGVVTIDGISYTNGSPSAVLSYTQVGIGTATITVTATDNGGNANNNGNQVYTTTFDIDVISTPVTGKAFEFAGGTEGWWVGGGSRSAVGGEMVYVVNKGKWDPFGVNFNPHMDITANPYITVRAYATSDVDLAMWYFDGAGNYSNNNPQRMHITTSYQEYTFNYTDPINQMTSGGVDVDITDVTSLHCLIAPGSAWSGTVYFDYIRVGDPATKPTFQVLIDTVPNQTIFEGSSPVIVPLTGISDGDTDDDAVLVTATSSNTALVPNPVVSAVVDGKATLTYSPAATGTGTAIITVSTSAPNSTSKDYTFTIEVLDPAASTDETVSVDYSTTYQTIEGFGAYGYNISYLKEYYDDLGASAIRLGFIGQQIERVNDNSDPNELNRDALDYTAYDWDVLRELHDNGVETFILTSWSPPAWMKENLSESYQYAGTPNYADTDNKLLPEYYAEFAEMWVAIIKMLKEESGVDLYGIGPQNEPAFCEPYASGILDPVNFPIVLKVIGQRLEAEGLSTKLYMPEQVFSQGHYSMAQYIDALQLDNEADRLTYAIATHGYASDGIGAGAASQAEWTAMWDNSQECAYAKKMWMTETSGGENTWDDFMNAAGAIHGALEYGNVSLWTWWSFHVGSGGRGYGLIAGSEKTPRYYSTKQFSKFIRPGAQRLSSTSNNTDLLVTSFKNDAAHGDNTAIVLINKGTTTMTVDLSLTGGSAPDKFEVYQTSRFRGCEKMGFMLSSDFVALPPMSVTTLVSSANLIPTIDEVDDQINQVTDPTQTINLTGITDGGDGGQIITVSAVSSDPTVVNNVNVSYTSPATTATLTYDIVGTATETSTITITVQDNGGTGGGGQDIVTESFLVSLFSGLNYVPTLDDIANVTINEDDGVQTVNLTGIADGDDGSQTLTVTVGSSNTALIPTPMVSYSSGATGSISFTPTPELSGTAIITVTVTDDGGEAGNNGDQSVEKTFTVAVNSINDQPTIDIQTVLSAIPVTETRQQAVYFKDVDDGDIDVEQILSTSATATPSGIIQIDDFEYMGEGIAKLSYTPLGVDGTAKVVALVQDDGGTERGGIDTVTMTINIVIGDGGGVIDAINSPMTGVSLYPVPASDNLQVTMPQGKYISLSVVDISGRVLSTQAVNGSSAVNVKLDEISSGMYILQLVNDNFVHEIKFIKK